MDASCIGPFLLVIAAFFELKQPKQLCADPPCHAWCKSGMIHVLMVCCMFCRRGLLAIRGCFGFGAIGCYFFAVTLLPLNDAMVITFLAPLVVALASPVVIKESPPK